MLKPWIETTALHSDVLSDTFSEDIFALDLGPLADWVNAKTLGLPTNQLPIVPPVYRDPQHFFQSSYLTTGLKSLLNDVLGRLSDAGGNRVLKLVTAFGGGKSHTLASLLHAASFRDALDSIPEGRDLPRPGAVHVAVFDGQFFDAEKGKELPGTDLRARTMWGWIAWSLGGREGYERLRQQDEARVAPGADELIPLLREGANLILLDEVLEYLISAGGIKIEETTLRHETLNFLKHLTVAVGNVENTALVFSLQSSKRESLDYVHLLQTVEHLAARKDQRREPVEGNEILSVIQRRLLVTGADSTAAVETATAYQQVITHMRQAWARTPAERLQAEEEGIALRNRFQAAYPFHPALIDLMRERWAASPDFQQTRGALRFLAACLRACHKNRSSRIVLGPGDVPIEDAEVRLAFFKEVGQQSDFQAVVEHDFIGPNSRTRRIDDRRARENPSEIGRRSATRLATAILMYSFGGLRRDGGGDGDILPAGVSESELMAACVGPDLDSTTAQACLKELREQCLYLHFDGARYCFKKDPNITLLIEQETELVGRDDSKVRTRIREMLEERLGGHRSAIVWPARPADIPDNDTSFLVAYLPLEFGQKAEKDSEALEYFEMAGNRQRTFRNGICLAVPSEEHIEALRRAVRYLTAIEQIKTKSRLLNLTDVQRAQLAERESTERAAVEACFLRLYVEIWLPRAENGNLGIEKIAAGGRPLQTTLDDRKRAKVHDRVLELLLYVQPKVFGSLVPTKIVDLFQLGCGENQQPGIPVRAVVEGIFSYLGFPRLTDRQVISRSIQKGISDGIFAYLLGTPEMGNDGQYRLDLNKVRLNSTLLDDEIDLESGFLIVPSALPRKKDATADADAVSSPDNDVQDPNRPIANGSAAQPIVTGTVSGGPPASWPVPNTVPGDAGQREISLTFSADKNKLFTAWRAIANLAEMTGRVTVSIEAVSEEPLDQNKLNNGVLEPLREQGLID